MILVTNYSCKILLYLNVQVAPTKAKQKDGSMLEILKPAFCLSYEMTVHGKKKQKQKTVMKMVFVVL